MARKPTTYDVAQLAQVSQATVSYVLSRRRTVSIPDETREHVLRAARALGYRSNNVARALVRGKSQTIGVIVPQIGFDYQSVIVQGIYGTCAGHDYRVLIGYCEHDPDLGARQVEFLLEHRVEGFICVADEGAVSGMEQWIENMAAEDVPCVVVDDRTYAHRADCVVSDDVPGASAAVKHLIDLGHTRIGHLGAGGRLSTSRDRNAGFRAAMSDAGLEVAPSAIADGSYFQEQATHAAIKLIEHSACTAILAASDLLALLLREEAQRRGMRVPGDLAIVGYGNTEVAAPLRLTTVDQQPRTLGQTAAERLMQRLAEPGLNPEETRIPTNLLIRGSCGGLA